MDEPLVTGQEATGFRADGTAWRRETREGWLPFRIIVTELLPNGFVETEHGQSWSRSFAVAPRPTARKV